MKNKGLQTWLYSSLGVVAMFVIIVIMNALASGMKTRIDLTAERAYTLSAGTRAILSKLDTPIQIRFYCTRGDTRMPVMLKTYAQRVEDLLGEYRQVSKGQIDIQKLDPIPDSEAEDSARLDGIEGQARMDGEPFYLGLSISMLDQKQAITFLSPDRERLLEYDISRAISRVLSNERPVVGVMSPLAYGGQPTNPMMMRMGQSGQQPWVMISELKRDFTVKDVPMTAEEIPADVKVLVLLHPKGISDAAQYAVDQFVLRGGKLIAFLDPQGVLDRSAAGNPMGASMGSRSSLDKLLGAWGLAFDSTKVLADLEFVGRTREGRQPAVLALNEKASNRDDVVSADANNLFMVFAGVFSGTPVEGLKQTVLLHSSKNSQLVDPMSAQFGGEKIIKDFAASNTEHPLAVRLSGKFKTAFPEGKPKAAAGPEDKKEQKLAEEGLKESKQETSVLLIGDSDFIQDQVAVQEMANPFGGQRMVMPANGNLAFAQSAIEQMAGDSNLVAVRSRASRERQFTVVKQMQAKAEAAFQSKIKTLESSLAEAQNKLNELQRTKADKTGQRFILSPEQQQEINNFRVKEREVKAQLKEERKKLRVGIDSLENSIKWINIALMPLIVAAAGLGLAALRLKRRAAR
ncbi:MAG: auxiliary component [Verrucomicrobia bacterium]|nr:MAG: auxiliary component [Verrucomicrobiota bacterium]